ncbi:energy transducer TonB [Cyclobacterium xiamenense]|uniref:energy transducer TonB n=1 Tax=Cyclobacterium xiamenense TaxID=1297121 RepID=UPI0035D0AD13
MEIWEDQKETQDNKKKAVLITFFLNVLLLIGLYFIVVWKQPVPPMSQFGLELNLGFSDTGMDNEQATTAATNASEVSEEAPAPGDPSSQPTENTVPVSPTESSPSPAQPSPSEPQQEIQSNIPSPVRADTQPRPAAERPKETPETPAETLETEAPVEAKPTPEKVEEKQPTVDQRAIFGAGGTTGSSNRPSSGENQGSSGQPGNEGNPQGTVDGRSILQSGSGNTGDGSGYNLDLAGWDFASRPQIQDRISNRNGRIVFRITVNDNGRIVQAIPLEYNVSNEVLNYYRTVVTGLSFKRQSDNPTADYSTGRITFIIRVD